MVLCWRKRKRGRPFPTGCYARPNVWSPMGKGPCLRSPHVHSTTTGKHCYSGILFPQAVMRIHVLEPEGDVLVFLTGQEEIEAMVGVG